ncbi:uncharacterized protein RAG0_10818 [Rhynchosporium agropyri]|uniref:Cupin type-1 domain-containing protein n=1 Tax=Rhynchosporium agropyri TaxID=914238 RepID=A0A1E1L400_9HELO|nr:uncharacterized protein RAG0_10818 [Rhynchosporium agropyri]
MSKVEVHPKPLTSYPHVPNPLPQLLQTPSGLALLEMQGTINLPSFDDEESISTESQSGIASQETPIGRLIFPDYDPAADKSDAAWMKRVYLYVGKHQRLTGEVKKLPKALAVIRKRNGGEEGEGQVDNDEDEERVEQLEVVEIVKYKILFSIRPEPVGTSGAGDLLSHITPPKLETSKSSSTSLLFTKKTTHKDNMASETSLPEQYSIRTSTSHVPNSPLPVLVYRAALPANPTPESTYARIEPNKWLKGGIFKHCGAHHFHSVTHECYAVFKGHSRLLLGRGPLDPEAKDDVVVKLGMGDAIVLPAGVAHCSIESSQDYEYVGLYPEGSPRWDNNFCKADEDETSQKVANARAVPIPDSDPIFGIGGPLIDIWRKALG